jgi:hypothetical protein
MAASVDPRAHRPSPRALAVLSLLAAGSRSEAAEAVHFGPSDVQTVFAIGKSDDHNQMQYAVRLTKDCRPAGKEPVFGYWREYDNHERLLPMGWLDSFAYGIDRRSSAHRCHHHGRSRPPQPRNHIEVSRGSDGGCSARPYIKISVGAPGCRSSS